MVASEGLAFQDTPSKVFQSFVANVLSLNTSKDVVDCRQAVDTRCTLSQFLCQRGKEVVCMLAPICAKGFVQM